MSKSISRVLYWTVIYLRYTFLHTSSHPLRRRASLTLLGVLHQVGFTRLQGLPCTGELLPRLFILTNSHWSIIRTRLKISILGIFWLVVLERHKAFLRPSHQNLSQNTRFSGRRILRLSKIVIIEPKTQVILSD